MTHLVEVAFRGNRKEFFQWDAETAPALKAGVIVEADRGEDFGRVHSTGELAELRCRGCAHGCGTTPPPKLMVRLASPEEVVHDDTIPAENESARKRAMEKVKAHNLVMKLTDAEWQWDRRKLTFYFTSERRVDFRGLVRDLAAMFRARIELKQIGVRDEAKRLSGIGRCGREYCSSAWLPDLRPVNLGVAKDQKLSLNPQQISGACGRLMCCLRYEHEFYVQSRRRFPKEGRILVTSIGEEKVISCDIFNDRVTLRSAEGDTRVVPLADLRLEAGGFGELVSSERVEPRSYDEDDTDEQILDRDETPRSVPSQRVQPVGAPRPARIEDPNDSVADTAPDAATDAAPSAPTATAIDPRTDPTTDPRTDPTTDITTDSTTDSKTIATPMPGTRGAAAGVESAEDAVDPKRKRRRGRRGGRRLRAAEQRRHGSDGSADAPDETDDQPDETDVAEVDERPVE